MITTITLNGNSVNLVALPAEPGFRSVEWSASDAVAIVGSPYTGQVQAQMWPGADMRLGTATLPSLSSAQADDWVTFLMEMRGMANATQIADPRKLTPKGSAVGNGTPVVDGGVTVSAGGTTLYTRGWATSKFRLLLRGDNLQVGYRLYSVMEVVNSDGSGKAAISIFPSLREVPTDGEAIVLNNPKGLFRLGTNKRTWSDDYTRLTRLSFPIQEYR